jgi:hypothetical protein
MAGGDGQRFLVITAANEDAGQPVTLLVNWQMLSP